MAADKKNIRKEGRKEYGRRRFVQNGT